MRELVSSNDIRDFTAKIDNFLIDCDGVIWRGNKVIPFVPEAITRLRSMGKKLYFVTNNSTLSRKSFVEKFARLGIAINQDEILSSGFITGKYALKTLPLNKKVYLIGEKGLEQELLNVGVQVEGGTRDSHIMSDEKELENILPDKTIGAVICGLDRQLNYRKYSKAYTYLQDPNCHFILTNDDLTLPYGQREYPGAGAVAAPLLALVSRKPIILGKPSPFMLEMIKECVNFDPSTTCMIGDRLETDIAFGKLGNMVTLAVLTGVVQASDLQSNISLEPDYVIASFGMFGNLFDGKL